MSFIFQILQPHRGLLSTISSRLVELLNLVIKKLLSFLHRIKNTGVTPEMNEYEKSRLGIFNYLNFFQLIIGSIVPIMGIFQPGNIPSSGWLLACMPPFLSGVVLFLNSQYRFKEGLLVYFIFYPLFNCLSYINGIDFGVELSFILYGILAVFFIRDIGYLTFSIGFSMVSYFILVVVLKKYLYYLEEVNYLGYLVNQVLMIICIFYGLYLIKKENANYQLSLMMSNNILQRNNEEIQKQAQELDQLNSLKNKLFSVIAHDLKAPMYALRNMFDDIQKQDMPAEEIKELVPDVKNDLNYTVSLMDNLLQWAKSQMQAYTVKPEVHSIRDMIDEVTQVLCLQAEAKKIHIENKATDGHNIWADRDMINLVLRNLISNAIKFSPSGAKIFVGTFDQRNMTEIYVKDSGKGITEDEMKKIGTQEFYSSNGTAHEQGTGLGLMLCREFLAKNNGKLRIQSEPGKGSVFSFTLPRPLA